MAFLLRLSLAAACFTAVSAAAEPGLVSTDFIYESAPFPECHASTVVETGGALAAAWFGGTEEKHPDVCIYFSKLESGKWSAPQSVADGVQPDGKRHPTWNPVLFQPASGPLLLFYKAGPSPSRWWGMMKTSSDHGKTWSAATRLPDGILGPIKNKPLLAKDGALLCPSSTEHDGWKVHFEWTSDLGRTWSKSPDVAFAKPVSGAIQPTLFPLDDNSWLALCRPRTGSRIVQTTAASLDNWTPLTPTILLNPHSGIDGVRLKDGRLLLLYNHAALGRSPLNAAVSADQGKTWQAALTLETAQGEFSYPAVIQTADGMVHATWTWDRKRIRHAVIDPAKLVLRPFGADGKWPE